MYHYYCFFRDLIGCVIWNHICFCDNSKWFIIMTVNPLRIIDVRFFLFRSLPMLYNVVQEVTGSTYYTTCHSFTASWIFEHILVLNIILPVKFSGFWNFDVDCWRRKLYTRINVHICFNFFFFCWLTLIF